MNNVLEIDLNEIASKQISEKIHSLEKELSSVYKSNSQQNKEIESLKSQLNNSEIALGLLNYLRGEYAKIKADEPDSDGWYNSKQKNQFLFIESILLNIFRVNKLHNGWLSCRGDGRLAAYLAVNFYHKKEVVISILKMLTPDYANDVTFIEGFRMPYDYTKSDVLAYAKEPKYNTNGCIFGISQYWVEYGAGKSNMPHDLIMKSPIILEDEVFGQLLTSIRKGVSNYYYLFALPKYNSGISEQQIKSLGKLLKSVPEKHLLYEELKEFIRTNILKFDNETLDYLYGKISSDNQFSFLYWENFPVEYQMKFLKSKSLDEILKLFTNYNCKWSIEEKQSFLKEYTSSK